MPENIAEHVQTVVVQNVWLNKQIDLKRCMRFTQAMLRHPPELTTQRVNHDGEFSRNPNPAEIAHMFAKRWSFKICHEINVPGQTVALAKSETVRSIC